MTFPIYLHLPISTSKHVVKSNQISNQHFMPISTDSLAHTALERCSLQWFHRSGSRSLLFPARSTPLVWLLSMVRGRHIVIRLNALERSAVKR